MSKIFFHVDVNSAFLSWSAIKHLRDGEDVDLRTIPAVVGGDEAQRHGVVLAKSGPAKKYGIKTGESLFAARTKYPGIKVVPPDFDFYVQNSKDGTPVTLSADAPLSLRQAVLVYDGEAKTYTLLPGSSQELCYLGDTALLEPQELAGEETLRLGAATLKFVPFCGPDFSW